VRIHWLVACCALAGSTIFAQGPTLVRLTVVARDARGEPADLGMDDFSITDQGKRQHIVFFRKNPLPVLGAPALHEVSNRSASTPPHATAVLLDLMNSNQFAAPAAWLRLRRSLSQVDAADSISFSILGDDGVLSRQLALGMKRTEHAMDEELKSAVHSHPPAMTPDDARRATYGAIQTLAGRLAAFPGGRDLVWITDRVPRVSACTADWVDCGPDFRNLISALGAGRVVVDPFSYASSAVLKADFDRLAGLTGGSVFVGGELRSALRQVARDGTRNYTLGYEVPADTWDGKFHRIQVTSRAGITIIARRGYYADRDPRSPEARQQAALLAAYLSPTGITDIGLRVTAAAASPKTLHLETVINPADVFLREDGGQFTGRLTILLSEASTSGPSGSPTVSSFNLRLTPEQRDIVRQTGILIAQTRSVGESCRKLVIVVMDQATGAWGSVTVPIPST
jgi:VWFA-related protein